MIEKFSQSIVVKRTSTSAGFGFNAGSSINSEGVVVSTLKYVSIRQLSAKEVVQQGMTTEDVAFVCKIRYRDNMNVIRGDIIEWNTKRLKVSNIPYPDQVGKKKLLVFNATLENS